jgi:hypothetical protein
MRLTPPSRHTTRCPSPAAETGISRCNQTAHSWRSPTEMFWVRGGGEGFAWNITFDKARNPRMPARQLIQVFGYNLRVMNAAFIHLAPPYSDGKVCESDE